MNSGCGSSEHCVRFRTSSTMILMASASAHFGANIDRQQCIDATASGGLTAHFERASVLVIADVWVGVFCEQGSNAFWVIAFDGIMERSETFGVLEIGIEARFQQKVEGVEVAIESGVMERVVAELGRANRVSHVVDEELNTIDVVIESGIVKRGD